MYERNLASIVNAGAWLMRDAIERAIKKHADEWYAQQVPEQVLKQPPAPPQQLRLCRAPQQWSTDAACGLKPIEPSPDWEVVNTNPGGRILVKGTTRDGREVVLVSLDPDRFETERTAEHQRNDALNMLMAQSGYLQANAFTNVFSGIGSAGLSGLQNAAHRF